MESATSPPPKPSRSTPDLLTLPSTDGSALLSVFISQSVPLLTLSVGDRLVLEGHISGLPCFLDTPFSVTSATAPEGDASHKAIFHDTNATLLLKQDRASQFHISVMGGNYSSVVEAAFTLGDASWFGLGFMMHQHWPLQKGILELGPFYPFDFGPNGVCTLLDPTLISTHGAVILADDLSRCFHLALNASPEDGDRKPLHFLKPLEWGTGVANDVREILPREQTPHDVGDGKVRLQSRSVFDWPYVEHPWLRVDDPDNIRHEPHLKFSIGGTENIKTASSAVLGQIKCEMSPSPKKIPPINMMKYPIWSTWARYKAAVTQTDVLSFANDIVEKGLPRSVMGIDDRWSVKYGDLEFDKEKFPDPAAMIHELHELGFFVTLWITPFANTDSQAVLNPGSRKYFVHTDSGELGEFEWWQPTRVAALDVTNKEACDWFVDGLQRLCDKYGLDGFKFDAGEPSFLPRKSLLEKSMTAPAEYTQTWIHRVASNFDVSEVRSGTRGCQNAAPMVRLFDKFSTWGLQNGLASVVAGLLTSGILGYPFCIPDYIAGNAYGDDLPDAELMVRWAQASAAMPAMQFSIPPWSMGEECEQLSRKALEWRADFFWSHISNCLEEAANDYLPIARPMFWEDPEVDGIADVGDQFMIGSTVVVAPILERGKRERKVFLPSGRWRKVNLNNAAEFSSKIYEGPAWLERVSAPLDEMPTFVREP